MLILTWSSLGSAVLTLIVLAVVLIADFVFRMEVYNRSDPVSFSLLGYSLVLVVSNALLAIVKNFCAARQAGVKDALQIEYLIAVVIYFVGLFIIFLLAKRTHRDLQEAQAEKIRGYLDDKKPGVQQPAAIWHVFQDLGAGTLEPVVFFPTNPKKRLKRIQYLKKLKDSTGANIIPEREERDLLVEDKIIKIKAICGYTAAFVYGTISALFFAAWQ